MDLLSDIVSLLRPHDCVAAGLVAGGDWAIRFNNHAGIKCNAVVRGGCYLSVADGPARWLEPGSCFILPHGRSFLVSSAEPGRPSIDETIYAPIPHGGTSRYGSGDDFYMTGSRFLLSGPCARVLLESLPDIIVVRPGSESTAVAWALERIALELHDRQLGSSLSIEHLSHFLLVQAMRRYLAEGDLCIGGWLAALSDPQISRALAILHEDPARPWTVEALAAEAGLSRTSFAVKFRKVTGQTPMHYLTVWRMLRAADRLERTSDPVSWIAQDAGYSSESAFTVAFRRTMGQTPRRFASRPAA